MLLFTSVLAQATDTLTDGCGPPEESGAICEGVFRATGNGSVARASEVFIARPMKIAVIIALAWVAAAVVRRAVRRFTKSLGTVSADVVGGADRSAGALLQTGATRTPRAVQRAETIGALFASIASFAIWGVAALTVLGDLGIELGPLLAGAGIVGVAAGFGAQNLVRDFLSGIFMLIEDQYGVGDVIDAGPATGTVEGVSLRTTRLRDVEGNVWHIPNGYINRVANKSQEWSRALIDVPVAYGTDTDLASAAIKTAADSAWRDPQWSGDILAEPEVWGVQDFGADALLIRLVVKTAPLSQWKVGRELRARIKRAFDAEGIEIPFAQRNVWHSGEEAGIPTAAGPGGEGGKRPVSAQPGNEAALR